MSLPDEYYPPFYPRVTHQWVWGVGDGPDPNGWQGQANSCVANALCSIKEIHEYKETGQINQYSIGWIFGNRYSDDPGEVGMYYEDALDKLISDGVPKYRELPENEYNGPYSWYYPDIYYYYDWVDAAQNIIGAKTLVNNNYANVINKSRVARISNWAYLSQSDLDNIKQHIIDDGAVLMNILVAQNFRDFGGGAVTPNGVIPPPNYSVGYYHAVVLIGWRLIDNKLHWIVHNNWGDWWWGDNGRCLMPYDYSYIDACFAVYDAPSPDIEPPTVTITSPQNNIWTNGTSITIQAVATDDLGYENIDYVNFHNSVLGTITDHRDGAYLYSATFDLSALPEGTHTFAARAYDKSGNFSEQDYVDIRVDRTPPTVSITDSSKTSDSITITVTGSDSASGQNGFQFMLDDQPVATLYGSSVSYTFSGLTENTQYKVGVKAFDNVLNYSSQVYQYITTESGRPPTWEWSYQALNAFQNGGAITNLTATEWNQFIQNIKDVVKWKTGITPTITNATSGGTFTATMFNQAKNAIGGINATGIADKSSGSPVIGNDFIILRDKLNGIV